EQQLVLLMNSVEECAVELVEIAGRLQCVVGALETHPLWPLEADRHAPQHHVLRLTGKPGVELRVELVAVRTGVGEELHDLDLSRARGGVLRWLWLQRPIVDALLQCRESGQGGGEKRNDCQRTKHRVQNILCSRHECFFRLSARWPCSSRQPPSPP